MKTFKNLLIIAFCLFQLVSFGQIDTIVYKSDFNGVRFRGMANFELLPSDSAYVEISTSDLQVFDYIKIHELGSMLNIDVTKKNMNLSKLFERLVIRVYFVEIEHIVLEGAGVVESVGAVISPRLVTKLTGTGKLDIEINTDLFEAKVFGTSILYTKGTTKHSIVHVEGIGSYNAKNLEAEMVDINMEGIGTAIVNASYELKASLTGIGTIEYVGEPKEKDFSINGIGSIERY